MYMISKVTPTAAKNKRDHLAQSAAVLPVWSLKKSF